MSLVKFESIFADLKTERSGDWQPSLAYPGVEYLVRSLHFPQYQTDLALLEQSLARKHKGSPAPVDERTVEIGKLLHKHILLDWRGLSRPYSPELAASGLCVPEGRNFCADVQNAAAMVSIRDVETVEDTVGNSAPPSGIASGTSENPSET